MRTYEVRISVPEDAKPYDARDRIKFLTTLMMKTVEGAPKWRAISVDFDSCVAVLEILAPRFTGLRSGRAIIDVTEKNTEGSTDT